MISTDKDSRFGVSVDGSNWEWVQMLGNHTNEEKITRLVEEIDLLMEHIWRRVVKNEYEQR